MLGYILQAFNEGLTKRRDQEYERARQEDEREFQMLATLAQHGSDDIRALAGTALMDLVSGKGGRRQPKKGLRGFLGEVEQSPYLASVQQALQTAQAAPTAQPAPNGPGAAALPGTSPVQPQAPRFQAAPTTLPARATAPAMAPFAGGGAGAPAPLQGAPGLQEPLPSTATVMGRMLPPPPKIRALFPDAYETAAAQARAQVAGRIGGTLEAYRGASPEEQRLIEAMSGRPTRQARPELVVGTVNGQDNVTGIFDPETQEITVDGIPVQMRNARKPSGTAPRPPSLIRSVDKSGTLHLIDPTTQEIMQSIPGVGKPQVPPPTYSGTATVMDEETGVPVVRRLPRTRGPATVGVARPTGSQVTDETKQYRAWLAEFERERAQRTKGPLARPLTRQQLDLIAADITGIPGMTVNGLRMGAQGQPQGRGARTGITPDRVKGAADELGNRMGLPPVAPPPPKKP